MGAGCHLMVGSELSATRCWEDLRVELATDFPPRYRVVLADPATFTEPATMSGVWFWKPGEEIKPFECALPDA